jgi:hypothetical protein
MFFLCSDQSLVGVLYAFYSTRLDPLVAGQRRLPENKGFFGTTCGSFVSFADRERQVARRPKKRDAACNSSSSSTLPGFPARGAI